MICFQMEIKQMGILSKDFWPLTKIQIIFNSIVGVLIFIIVSFWW